MWYGAQLEISLILSINFVSSLCSSFQSICFRNNLSNYHLSTFKADLSSLPHISYAWKAQQSVFEEIILPQLPSPVLHPTRQLDLYLCSLKVPGHVWNTGGLRVSGHSPWWWWWWCSQMWQMTESHHFPCTDPRHGCTWYLLCCGHRRGMVSRKDGVCKGEPQNSPEEHIIWGWRKSPAPGFAWFPVLHAQQGAETDGKISSIRKPKSWIQAEPGLKQFCALGLLMHGGIHFDLVQQHR